MNIIKEYVGVRSGVRTAIVFSNSVHTGQKLDFIGCSLDVSVEPLLERLDSFVVANWDMASEQKESKEEISRDVVAFATQFLGCDQSPIIRLSGLFPVTSDRENKLHVELDVPFVSPADRLAQILFAGNTPVLSVKVHGEYYLTHSLSLAGKQNIVPDGNLLCRFLVEKATLEEVKAAIVEAADGSYKAASALQQ